MPDPFVHTETVRFGDLDAMRHLNNVVFLRYFETARIAYLGQLAPDLDPVGREQGAFGFIYAEGHINYRSPVEFGEEVATRCTIGEVRRSSFRVDFTMHVEGRLAAEGYGWLVGFDYNEQHATTLPDGLRAALEREQQPA